jgi:hypothetical protein
MKLERFNSYGSQVMNGNEVVGRLNVIPANEPEFAKQYTQISMKGVKNTIDFINCFHSTLKINNQSLL